MEQATDGTLLSIVPPLVAIVLAIALRNAIVSLLLAVYVGVFIIYDFLPFLALQRFFDTYILNAIGDETRIFILLFCLLLSGMITIATSSGSLSNLAIIIGRIASTAKRAQISTWLLGMIIFIDDYANSLILGSTLKRTTDRLGVSREKLAFLVDSTAAPIASLAIISSWIAAEVSFVANEFTRLGITKNPFQAVIESIQYRYYPILMLMFVLMIALSERDFGPMLRAERTARNKQKKVFSYTQDDSQYLGHWYDALIPIVLTIFTIIFGMYIDGLTQLENHSSAEAHNIWEIFGESRAAYVLLWSAILGCFSSIILTVLRRLLTIGEVIAALFNGMKLVLPALIVLILAWTISDICYELGTAQYLANTVGIVPPVLIPTMVFIVSGVASFATGSSWGTMGIMFPLVIPLTYSIGGEAALIEAIASVLAGSVFGDHCSPISDTTILSSMATDCVLADHVRTQLPYALLVGIISIVIGELGVGLGWWNSWVGLALGCTVLFSILLSLGKRTSHK